MNDRTTILLSALAGAVAGGCAGYLFLTEDGRRLRDDVQPKLMELATEIERAMSMVKNARADVASIGR